MSREILTVLKQTDFDWSSLLDSVWHDPQFHVPALHQEHKERILSEVKKLWEKPSSLSESNVT